MNKFFLSSLIIPFLLISCTTEEVTDSNTVNASGIAYKEKTSPENANNPFDNTGRIYMEIFETSNSQSPVTTVNNIINVVDNAANGNNAFTQISGNYNGLNAIQVQWLLDNSSDATVINNLSVSETTKSKLQEFMNLYSSLLTQNANSGVAAITAFENQIINDAAYTLKDKQVILITTSIARHQTCDSNHRKRGNHLRLSLYGAMKGADNDIKLAITMAVATGMAE